MPRQKQAAPTRNPNAALLVSSPAAARSGDGEELSEDELDVFGPPLTARRARDDEEEEEEGGAGGKGKKKRAKTGAVAATGPVIEEAAEASGNGEGDKKPRAPRGVSSTVYEGGDDDFDAEVLAADYASAADGGGGGTAGVGKAMHAQLLTAARLEASVKGAAEVAVVTTAEGERPTFFASFKFSNGKRFQDEGPLYTVDEMARVLAAVLRRASTKRRKATASHPSVQLKEIARRSPPLFWSLAHAFPADLGKGLETVLAEAEAAMERE